MKKTKRMIRDEDKINHMYTISGFRSMVHKMQIAGAIFALTGIFLPKLAPFYAKQSWKFLFGLRVPLPSALIAVGCVMLIISIVCFLRSYRCAKCGGILALTTYTEPKTCRCCGAKLKDTDLKRDRDQFGR